MSLLKIEKKKADVLLTVHQKKLFFTPSFLLAFLIALFIHLLFFTLFYVGPFRFERKRTLPFLPAFADPVLPKSVHLQETHELVDLLSLPFPKDEPLFPLYPLKSDSLMKLEKENLDKPNAFIPLLQMKEPFSFSFPSYALNFSKGLQVGNLDIPTHFGPLKKTYRTVFNVEIDGETGKIAWLEKEISSQDKKIDRDVQNLLLSLSFENSHDFLVKGWVEVIVRK